MKSKVYIIIFLTIFLFSIVSNKEVRTPLEELQVSLGIGVDLKQDDFDDIYKTTVNSYVFENKENDGKVLVKTKYGSGMTFRNASQDRQRKEDKQYIMGQEKVFVFSEGFAKNGIKNYIDFMFKTSLINDKANVTICEGDAFNILNADTPKYTNSIDYLDGLFNIISNEYFSSEENKIIDIFTRITSKYRNCVLPYISIKNNQIFLKGFAMFDGDKMKILVDTDEGKILNLLRDNSGYGTITLFENQTKALDLYGTSKRKVTCQKDNGDYHFTINLNLKMSVLTNELNNDLINELKVKKDFEKLASKQIEADCSKFIQKMQNNYKVDYLDLKRVLVSKYGRDIDKDLNTLISNSHIEVKAKVTITNYGRGDY